MFRIWGIIIAWSIIAVPACIGQGLFESSRPGNHETLVSSKLSLGGFIRSLSYINGSSENTHYLQSVYGQAGLLLDAKTGDIASAHADIRLRYGNEFGEQLSDFQLREAYVDLWAGPFSLKAGKTIAPWGKGSVFNPTAKLTPTDPTVRSPEEDDRYLGSWAIQAGLRLGNHFRITGTWKPLYEPSILLIDPVPLPSYVKFLEPDYPDPELKEGSYGLKADLTTSALDASLYWFEGYHHWPGIAYDSFVPDLANFETEALNLFEKAYRIRMAGMDLSIPVGAWILRAEGAWQQSHGEPPDREYLPLPEISYTAEIERSGSNLTLIAGYYGKYILDYTPSGADASLSADMDPSAAGGLFQPGSVPDQEQMDQAVKEQIRAFNRLYNYQLEEFYHTIFMVGQAILAHELFKIKLPLIYNITTEELLIRPGIWYSPPGAEGFEIGAGFEGMYGPGNSLFDLVGPSMNAAWLSVRLSF